MDAARLYLYGDRTTENINQSTFVRGAGSNVYLAGSLDNTGDTLSQVGTIDFLGGAVTGGSSVVDFNATANSAEFADGVTLNADLNLTGAGDNFQIRNGLTLNGTANLSGSSAILDFAGTQTLGASSGQTATVDMTPFNAQLRVLDGGTLTLDSSVVVSGEGYVTGYGAGNAIVNEGLIHANHGSGYIHINAETFTNTGTLRASNDSGLSLSSSSFENHGAIELLDGSRLVTTGLGSAGLEIKSGAELGGMGTVIGNVTNTSGTISPGAASTTLEIQGDFYQESGGAVSIVLGGNTQGTDYGFLDITGSATLAGILSTSFLGSFMPEEGDTFVILEADGGIVGTFDSVFDPGGNGWSLNYQATQVVLQFDQTVVPEPGTHLLVGLGILFLAGRRRITRLVEIRNSTFATNIDPT